jgi:hypothetical protein
MDHAKFCLAAQGWSTPESVKSFLLLRLGSLTQQEHEYPEHIGATALRRQPSQAE